MGNFKIFLFKEQAMESVLVAVADDVLDFTTLNEIGCLQDLDSEDCEIIIGKYLQKLSHPETEDEKREEFIKYMWQELDELRFSPHWMDDDNMSDCLLFFQFFLGRISTSDDFVVMFSQKIKTYMEEHAEYAA